MTEVLIVGFAWFPMDAQVLHQLSERGGEHDDPAGVVLSLADHLGADPYHEQSGLLPVGPDVGRSLACLVQGLGVNDVCSVPVCSDPLGGVMSRVADGEGYAAEV